MTICIYGDFEKKDIKVKLFTKEEAQSTYQFRFQNILRDAGYDAELFHLNDEESSVNLADTPSPT